MKEHDQIFPVNCLFHYHWAASLLLFPGLASCLWPPFRPFEKARSVYSTFSSTLSVFIDYTDAGNYVHSFKITMKVIQRGQV
jgi:hypothetical protein